MTPETTARQHIDQKLAQAGWLVQDMPQLNLAAGVGVAVREYPTDSGPADYVLFVNRDAVGVIEAKKDSAGENLIRALKHWQALDRSPRATEVAPTPTQRPHGYGVK